MPFFVTAISNGCISRSIMAEKPKLVGQQRFIRETLSRCVAIEEISKTDARAGIKWLIETRPLREGAQ